MTFRPTSVQIIDRDGKETEIGHLLTRPIMVTGADVFAGMMAEIQTPISCAPAPFAPNPEGYFWVSAAAKRSQPAKPRRKWTGRKLQRRIR